MDINSLLSSPRDPPSGHSSPVPPISPHKPFPRPRSNSTRQSMAASSPLVHQVLTHLREPSPQVASPTMVPRAGSVGGTPPSSELRATRQGSTPGIEALADAASMQHHQPQRSMIRNTESYDTHLSPSTIYPNVNHIPRNTPTPRGSLDLSTVGGLKEMEKRDYAGTSLSSEAQKTATELFASIQQNRHDYHARVKFIRLLHQGFVNHVYPPFSPDCRGDPHKYDILKDLREAREEMDKLFAIGEDLWAEWIQDESLLARTVEERISVMELCVRSVDEEFGSTKLWTIYGEWMLHLYNSASQTGEPGTTHGQWSEEDKAVGREVFGWQSVMNVWKRGAEATRWRINDSHLVWDRYLNLAVQDLGNTPSSEKVSQVRTLFDKRLQLPHMTWDQTFQTFSNFVSKHYSGNYEQIMVSTTKRAAEAKAICNAREVMEAAIHRAVQSGDTTAEWTAFSEYIEWELAQDHRKYAHSFDLAIGLYQRAVLRFPTVVSLWEDYVMFSVDESIHGHIDISAIPALERATRHCPWSGALWSQLLLSSEREGLSSTKIHDLKHKATRTGLLDTGGIDEVLKFHIAWCSYLRRRAFQPDSTDEDLDVAEVGMRSAIESVQALSEKDGEPCSYDPLLRLQRIYIHCLSESGSWDSARESFRGLAPRHGNSYEFWLMYYTWELLCWSKFTQSDGTTGAARKTPNPSYATAVLKQGLQREDLDWPEKIMDTYIAHCEHYEDADELQSAVVEIRKATKALAKRREREAREAAAREPSPNAPVTGILETVSQRDVGKSAGKRKRQAEPDDELVSKRTKANETEVPSYPEQEALPSTPKRDRENATVIVKNLPSSVTTLKIRQYFRDCGKINALKILPAEGDSVCAIIEFDSKGDAVAAQTRDQKILDGRAIEVQIGAGTTLFVTNFPPTADEAYIRNLFGPYGEVVDVRFPSLKFNTHRRFCYVQFESPDAAYAAISLDGKVLGGNLELVVKMSDPSRRQDRTGPVQEGREIHISNIAWEATEDDLRDLFSPYGTVETARIPTKADGSGKGFGFVVFSSKEEANAALSMDQEEFRSRPLRVRISVPTGAKRHATKIVSQVRRSKSPSVEANGLAASPPDAALADGPIRERSLRTLGLMNIPDTVNDARIHSLVSPYGPIVKIVLRPDHQGAIVEFLNVSDAGKASLELEGREILPGRAIRVGSVPEMLKQSAERKIDRIQIGKQREKLTIMPQPAGPIRRPQQPGRRGGLGVKRGAINASGLIPMAPRAKKPDVDGEARRSSIETAEQNMVKKTNKDFRAMLRASKTESVEPADESIC